MRRETPSEMLEDVTALKDTSPERELPDQQVQELAERILADVESGKADLNMASLDTDFALLEKAKQRASELARRMSLDQAKADEERRIEYQKATAEGRRLKPVSSFSLATANDMTIPMDRDGQLAGDPSKVYRWVRMIGQDNNPSDQRVSEMRNYGYAPVKSREDGKPITAMRHILMQCSPEAEAQRKAHALQGLVAHDQSERAA